MALTIYREQDANLPRFVNTRVVIIGYGSQGRAHALNLRDSGVNVVVGQRAGQSWDRAVADGFTPVVPTDALDSADLVVMAVPDESAAEIYESQVGPHLHGGQALGFLHGFNLRFGFISPDPELDVIMIAPKGPGALLRSLYLEQKGLPALMAVHQDATGHAKRIALAWAVGLGCARAGVVATTVEAETDTDLFGEQAVLCGGMTALMKAAFDTLVEAGYEPEFAYLECIHELKQIADLIYESGLNGMRSQISNTAEYGDLTRGSRIINDQVREEMKRILEEVRSGAFAKEWIEEHKSGGSRFQELHNADSDTPLEHAGQAVRSLMPWLSKSKSSTS